MIQRYLGQVNTSKGERNYSNFEFKFIKDAKNMGNKSPMESSEDFFSSASSSRLSLVDKTEEK
jgi:hypothetical protein